MTTRISHWIDGTTVAGTSGRIGPVFNPATGEQTGEVDLAGAAEVDARGRVGQRGGRRRGGPPRCRGAAAVLFAFRELLHARAPTSWPRSSPPSTARCSPTPRGEIARGLENVEFACGVPHLLKGGYSRAGRRPASTSTRSASRSASSPASRRSTSRRWCRCGCAPTRSPAATRSSSSRARRTRRPRCSWPSCGRRPACPTASSPSCRATRRPSTRSSTTPTSPRSASSARPRSRATSTRPARPHGKRVQALGGAKNHMVVLPDADVDLAADAAVSAGYGSAGERCMAISVVVAVGDVGDPLVDAIAARLPKLRIGDGADPDSRDGPADHRASTATRCAGYVDAGRRPRARRVVVDGRDGRRARPTGFFLGTTLLDHVTPEMSVYTDEIFGPVLSRRAGRDLRRGARPDQRQPVRQRHRDLHPRRRRGPAVPVRRRGRHGRHQRADPGAGRPTTPSAAGRPRCSATPTCTARRASTSTPGARSSRRAGPTRRPRPSTSASRGPAR